MQYKMSFPRLVKCSVLGFLIESLILLISFAVNSTVIYAELNIFD